MSYFCLKKCLTVIAALGLLGCEQQSSQPSDDIWGGQAYRIGSEEFLLLTSTDRDELSADEAFRVYMHLAVGWSAYGTEHNDHIYWRDLALAKGSVSAAQHKIAGLISESDRSLCLEAQAVADDFKKFPDYDELEPMLFDGNLAECAELGVRVFTD